MTFLILMNKIRCVLLFPIIIITALTTPDPVNTDTAVLKSQELYVMGQALASGQGITSDGEYLYTSGALAGIGFTILGKMDLETMTYVKTRINPLPDICRKRGNDHIGGISYCNGKIYASVEGGDTVYACIVVFSAETLKPTGEIYDLPNENYDDGIPWLAVDSDTGYLYASKWSDTDTVYVYDVNDGMKLIKEITLTDIGKLDRIQGGEFYNGILYLSQDNKNSGTIKKILALDPESGAVTVVAERDVNKENTEAEGMTFITRSGENRLLVLDYNKAVGLYMREYEINI